VYKVPAGKSFVRFYCEIVSNTVSSDVRFDDAMLQRSVAGGGFTYTPPPTLSSITPNSGGVNGGTSVTLMGANFVAGTTVTVGGIPATNVNVLAGTSLTAVTPADNAGMVDVLVTNPDSQSATLSSAYTYLVPGDPPGITQITPSAGPTYGGTTVVISGSGFSPGATVMIGGTTATNI